jgi:hypothetical protein
MNNYTVHLYTQVRVKVTGIQAENMEQAMDKAERLVDLYDLLNNKTIRVSKHDLGNGVAVEEVEWADCQPDSFVVDPLLENGEVDYPNSRFFGPDRLPFVDGLTSVELLARAAGLANTFMQELLDSVETLTGIAEEHGARTLADLMYLQQAILDGGFIDYYPEESKVLEISQSLPSGAKWEKYIKVEYLDKAQES